MMNLTTEIAERLLLQLPTQFKAENHEHVIIARNMIIKRLMEADAMTETDDAVENIRIEAGLLIGFTEPIMNLCEITPFQCKALFSELVNETIDGIGFLKPIADQYTADRDTSYDGARSAHEIAGAFYVIADAMVKSTLFQEAVRALRGR